MAYEQILVRITGKDRIGLTAAFTGILAKYDAQILDIGQADIHSTLSLGILIRIDEQSDSNRFPTTNTRNGPAVRDVRAISSPSSAGACPRRRSRRPPGSSRTRDWTSTPSSA